MKNSPESIPTCSKSERSGFITEARSAFESGRVEQAIRIYEEAISQGHGNGSVYKTLGEMYLSVNEYEKALKWLQKAGEFKPDSGPLLDRLVLALVSLGRVEDAIEHVYQRKNLYPNLKVSDGSITEALIQIGQIGGASVADSSDPMQMDPGQIKAILMAADLFLRAKQYSLAEKWYRIVIANTDDALTCAKLACASRFLGHFSDAIKYQEMAVAKNPDNAEYAANLGTLLMSMGQIDRGMEILRTAVEKAPDQARIHSSFLANLHYLPNLDSETLSNEHKRWGQVHAPAERARVSHNNIADPERRLRVGYISADFRIHSVAYNFEAFLDCRDSGQFEVFGYANVAAPDAMTDRLKSKFDHYRNIHNMDDRKVVGLIEQDRIDILVEIGGHTTDNRLGVLAYKPAPIQVDYGGFNTSGMEQIDYRLTDSLLDPPELQKFYVEKSIHLPGGLFCYSPAAFAPAVGPLPAKRNGYITFGSFNNSIKVNDYTVLLWAEVLRVVEGSGLLLKFRGGGDREMQNRFLAQFEQVGVAADRITICGWKSPAEHLELYNQVDIALDTYPFNGCMTTLEGMWMGVPIVSLVGGKSLLSRAGLSILSRLGLEFFAASTPSEYVAKAAALASKQDALEAMRASLRERMRAGTLCDAGYYARSLEQAYRGIWRKWCKSRNAAVTPDQDARDSGDERPAKSSGILEFFISEKSPLQFIVSKENLPSFLLKAGDAVKTGNISEADSLLNDQAVETVRQIVCDDPSRVDALFMLAALFAKIGKVDKAEQFYKEVLEHRPHPLVLFELGNICRDTGRLSQAVRYQEQAVKLSPDSPELWTTLAEYLIRMGQAKQGIDILRNAVEKAPDKVNHSKYLYHLHQLPELDQQMLFEEHLRWARIHAPVCTAKLCHDNDPDPDRKLRIGYISPDFCGHSVAYFFASILDGRNREMADVYGYGNVPCPDEVTEYLKNKFDHYGNICGLKDEKVVRMIEDDKIDILIDLAGHTSGNGLGVMAFKPAPVQVTYLGFPNTTGMRQIDYRLTDELADRPESQKYYTERLVFLPHGFLCYKAPGFAPPVAPLPAIETGYFTFGSFNNNCKIQAGILELWARILKSRDKSRMLLKFGGGDDEGVREHYYREFERLGIARERIEICGRKSNVEHLAMYGRVDMALDTYPYNGTTTTCEAMWMGVPTLSLVGDAHSSRVGLSLLSRVGLGDFAAATPDEYVGKAVAFSYELDNMAKIRAALRPMMFNSPLCDAKRFTGDLEAAYREMWRRWCRYGQVGFSGRAANDSAENTVFYPASPTSIRYSSGEDR